MSNAYYAHVRYVGLNGRTSGENEAPLRLVDGQIGVKRRSVILPVHAIDDEGYALVDITAKTNALMHTPRTAEGHYDYDALKAQAPAITNPWDVAELAGLKTVGPKPDDTPKPTKSAAAPEATPAPRTALRINAGKPKPAAEKPKASEQPLMDREAVINYLAGLTQAGMGDLIAELSKAKAAPAKAPAKAPKAKRSAR